ncbi:MAG: arylsulfatase [Bryobacterales bacterium]|nr:arylsulfatase [Bryobacterales bacterium]
MLMADQHRGDCLGVDGHPVVKTPNLDRIAKEGVRFTGAYSSTPSCTPARGALLTGLSPWNHGQLGYGRVARQYPFEKPRALAEAGYYTQCIGKNHFSPQRNSHGYQSVLLDESKRAETPDFRSDYRAWFYSQAPTFDPDETGLTFNDYRGKPYVLPERLHPTKWTGDCAVNFLESYAKRDPFFLKVSFARPHSPYDPPERFHALYKDAQIPKAAVGKWAAARYSPRSDNSNDIWHGDMGEETVRNSRACYYGNVSFIDEQIGRILGALEKRGWLENTLILYFSDHGDMTGDQNLWRKCYAYEPSARIPFLMRWPKGLLDEQRGQTMRGPVELRDVFPTLLDAAGIRTQRQLDGASLLRLVKNQGRGWREYIDLEHAACYSPRNQWTALTDGRWKYIFHTYEGEEQLFDLTKDPQEMNDLAADTSAEPKLREWRSRMIAHLEPRGEPFVSGGKLAVRTKATVYSPNYPDRAKG